MEGRSCFVTGHKTRWDFGVLMGSPSWSVSRARRALQYMVKEGKGGPPKVILREK